MKIKLLIIGILLLASGGIIYFTSFKESENSKVLKVLSELCTISSKKSGANPVATALALQKSDKIFADKIRLDFHHHLFNKEFTCTELTARISQIQTMFQWLKIKVEKPQVTINQNQAFMTFTGVLDGVIKNGQTKVSEVREIDCELEKINGKWLITAMKVQNVLEK